MIDPGIKQLACAVILQWMEDYINLFKKPRRRWTKEDKITFNWLKTEDAEDWCYLAGINVFHLKKWKEKVDSQKDKIKRLNISRRDLYSLQRKIV